MKVKIGEWEIRIEADGNDSIVCVFKDGELLDDFPARLCEHYAYIVFYNYAGKALQEQRGEQ